MLYEGTLKLEAPKSTATLSESEARSLQLLSTMRSGVGATDQFLFGALMRFCVRDTQVNSLSRSEATEEPLAHLETSVCRSENHEFIEPLRVEEELRLLNFELPMILL